MLETSKKLRSARSVACSILFTSLLACQLGDERGPLVDPITDCSVEGKNAWLYDLMTERYLWHEHLPDLTADEIAAFETPNLLLDELRYAEIDRWSYIRNAQAADDYYDKGKGLSFGHKTVKDEDGNKWISFVNDPSPAWDAGLRRGDLVLADEYVDEDKLILTLDVQKPDGTQEQVQIEKAEVKFATVPYELPIDAGNEKYGYLMFRTFVEPSKDALDTVFDEYRALGITKVIIDLRYNGGGLISVARHLGDLLVGLANEGELSFTYKHNDIIAGEDKSYYYGVQERSIETSEVVFIVGPGTASASELVVNMVRPYVKTTLVGSTTSGKPVGMYSHDFCEDKVSPVQFRMINVEGYGDYYDGIEPDCAVPDDLLHDLNDVAEARIAESVTVLRTGGCTPGRAFDPAAARDAYVPDYDDLDRHPGALDRGHR